MYQLRNSPPFPAAMVGLAALAGAIGSRYLPDDIAEMVTPPQAAMASLAFDKLAADVQALPTEGDAASRPTQASRASDGLFYVHAQVNGQPVRFLVDTGASVTMLRGADAEALGLTPSPDRYGARVQTVGGSAAMAWTHLASIRIAGREIRDVRAGVVRQGLGVSLLGQNMLQRLGSVKIEGDRLELR